MNTYLQFLGAAGTVTGSKYLLRDEKNKLLIDCGLFQGSGNIRERNWRTLRELSGVAPKELSAVLLTHAHLDHSGLLPKLQRDGLESPVFCTPATASLTEVILRDSAKIQEEDAEYRARKNLSRHSPPLPLYTSEDTEKLLSRLKEVEIGKPQELTPGVEALWTRSGHILGAASISVKIAEKRICFSGDLGRYDIPILRNPEPVEFGDLLVIESTYGSRRHSAAEDVSEQFAKVINETVNRKGVLVVPSFAIGRAQFLLYHIRELKERKLIPDIPVFVDSPMALDATEVYARHPDSYDQESQELFSGGQYPFQCSKLHFIRSVAESKKLNGIVEPMIIIAASGMVEGGRVVHHLFHRISSPLTTVLFVGHQAEGTKGALLQSGAESIRLLKQEVDVRARIETLKGVSGHGDRDEMLRWIRESVKQFGKKPSGIAVTHGNPKSSEDFAEALRGEFQVLVTVPKYLEKLEIV